MIDAAIQSLSEPELFGDFAPGEMQRLIEQGENSGDPIPFDVFRAKMEQFKAEHRAKHK
jgi:hypothetical protein